MFWLLTQYFSHVYASGYRDVLFQMDFVFVDSFDDGFVDV